jgi:hypothetical protein
MNNIAKYNVSRYLEDIWDMDAMNEILDFDDGFRYHIKKIRFQKKEFNLFISEISKHYGKLDEFNYSLNKNSVHKKFINDKMRIYTSGDLEKVLCEIHTKSEEIKCFLWSIYINNIDQNSLVKIKMQSFIMKNGCVNQLYKEIDPKDFNFINKKYYPYIDTDIMFDQFFTGKDNILFIVGETGVGKSKLASLAIKHAYENTHILPYNKYDGETKLENQYVNVVNVKSSDVLINDEFWQNLEFENFDFVIIDDLDFMLSKRDNDIMTTEDSKKNTFLNQFLSFTDGFQQKKTKFIITTNQNHDEIDSALLRKGRLFDVLELRSLNKAEALVIWENNNLDKDKFKKTFTSNEIVAAELGSEINKHLNKRITTTQCNYLTEEGISRIKNSGISKKIVL